MAACRCPLLHRLEAANLRLVTDSSIAAAMRHPALRVLDASGCPHVSDGFCGALTGPLLQAACTGRGAAAEAATLVRGRGEGAVADGGGLGPAGCPHTPGKGAEGGASWGLRTVRVGYTRVGDEGLVALLLQAPRVRALNLAHCAGIDGRGLVEGLHAGGGRR